MSEQQPDALRLAEFALARQTHLGPRRPSSRNPDDQQAWDDYSAIAAELRRFHAENEALRDSVAAKADRIDRLGEMVERLQAENEALRAELSRLQAGGQGVVSRAEAALTALADPSADMLDAFQLGFARQLKRRKHYKKGWEMSAEQAGIAEMLKVVLAKVDAPRPPAAPAKGSATFGALRAVTAECNKLRKALELACSHLTDEQAAEVAAAMPTEPAAPALVPLNPETIAHFVDTHVGDPTPGRPLGVSDWINFARAIEHAHGINGLTVGGDGGV